MSPRTFAMTIKNSMKPSVEQSKGAKDKGKKRMAEQNPPVDHGKEKRLTVGSQFLSSGKIRLDVDPPMAPFFNKFMEVIKGPIAVESGCKHLTIKELMEESVKQSMQASFRQFHSLQEIIRQVEEKDDIVAKMKKDCQDAVAKLEDLEVHLANESARTERKRKMVRLLQEDLVKTEEVLAQAKEKITKLSLELDLARWSADERVEAAVENFKGSDEFIRLIMEAKTSGISQCMEAVKKVDHDFDQMALHAILEEMDSYESKRETSDQSVRHSPFPMSNHEDYHSPFLMSNHKGFSESKHEDEDQSVEHHPDKEEGDQYDDWGRESNGESKKRSPFLMSNYEDSRSPSPMSNHEDFSESNREDEDQSVEHHPDVDEGEDSDGWERESNGKSKQLSPDHISNHVESCESKHMGNCT
nr:PREDICTED: uncharacterized protein LOC101313981 isoform X2 [Fragaria vesca subsp. vesca]